MNKLILKYKDHYKIILFFTILLLTVLAYLNRFVQDDAFISFRYAKNFVNGYGLVFNPGEHVEGYTNFLWTLLIALGIKLNFSPIIFSYLLGILFFIFSLIYSYKTAEIIFRKKSFALLTIILLGTNYTFSAYATGGLETQMQTAFFMFGLFLAIKSLYDNKFKSLYLFTISIISSILILIRPDSLIFSGIILLVLFYQIFQNENNKISKLIFLLAPFILISLDYLIWKQNYYGDILPNTYYAKATGGTSIIHGIYFVYFFITTYWFIPFILIFLFFLKKFIKEKIFYLSLIIIIQIIWTLYVIKVGGDFMEFRFFVPILPIFFITIVWILFELVNQKEVRIALISLIFLGSIFHFLTFRYDKKYGIESVKQLKAHLYDPNQDWIGVGKKLKDIFKKNQNILIATTAAGAVPYYSDLRTLDMYGLNDKLIAKEKQTISKRPGHQKIASINYLYKKNVNLLIGEPCVKDISFNIRNMNNEMFEDYFKYPLMGFENYKPELIKFPLNSEYVIYILYLNKNNLVNKAISEENLKVYSFDQLFANE